MKRANPLLKHLLELLRGGQAHATLQDVVKGFPVAQAGTRPPGMAHSAWELLEHMRIAQNDILVFSRSADYEPLRWPDDYWPEAPAPRNSRRWHASVRAFQNDLAAFERLLGKRAEELDQPFPWGQGQTLLREALLMADHNAWHLGQLMLVRRALGA